MAIDTVARNFSDTRVFVVGTNDPEIGCIYPRDYLGFSQSFDGPRYIIVGPAVSDEKLLRNFGELSSRYGVTLAQMESVRDIQTARSAAHPV